MQRSVDVLPDTNVILRYLLKDNEVQFLECADFFEKIRTGHEKALILESVIVESVYVLTKFYKVPKGEVSEILTELLHYKGVVNKDKDDLTHALKLFGQTSVDMVDCLVVAKAKNGGFRVFSFDKELNKLAAR